MAKTVNDAVLDSSLNYLRQNATKLCICSAQPTTYTEATSTYKLADKVISTDHFLPTADGDTSGRKTVFGPVGGILVATTGTATYIALVNTYSSTLLYVYPCASTGITSGKYIQVSASTFEIRDPQ